MSDIFLKSLSNFTRDVASGDAIRHLTDLGYTIPEIQKKLDYPTPVSQIQDIVWKHLVNTGVIMLEKPDKAVKEKVSYIKETDSLGRSSFRRVTEKIEYTDAEYVELDFGKRIYKNRAEFERSIEGLPPKARDYILSLPWPLQNVYHINGKCLWGTVVEWTKLCKPQCHVGDGGK